MKTLQELIALRTARAARVNALIKIMEGDGAVAARSLTEAESAELTEIRTGADALDVQIRNAEFLDTQRRSVAQAEADAIARAGVHGASGSDTTPEQRAADRFSLSRAVGQLQSRSGLSGAEAEMHQEAVRGAQEAGITSNGGVMVPTFITARADAATPTAASNLVPTILNPAMRGYEIHTPFQALGARMLTNIVGNQDFPIADFLAEAGYVGETASLPEIDVTVRKASLTAKPVVAKLPITMLLKARTGSSVDAIALETLAMAEGYAVSRAVLSGNGTTAPLGMLANTGITNLDLDTSGALTFSQMLKLKNAPGKNNARFLPGQRGWCTNEDVREQLEALQHGTSGRYIWDYEKPDTLMGYKAETTTLVPNDGGDDDNESAIIFGIWSNLMIANWAFRELVIDNVTVDGKTILKWYSYWDHAVVSPKAFAYCRNITTATAS